MRPSAPNPGRTEMPQAQKTSNSPGALHSTSGLFLEGSGRSADHDRFGQSSQLQKD